MKKNNARKVLKNKRTKKGRGEAKKRGFLSKVWRVVWITVVAVWGFTVLQVLLGWFIMPPLTPLMVQRWWQQAKEKDRPVRFERDVVDIEDISPRLVTAVVYAEDGLFMYHHGFDVKQMKAAYKENQRGRRIRGGSTISQQTAKNVFLPHSRTMLRKAVEAYYTVMIEAVWGKKRIMEVYLNSVEFGDGIYGCEAAAQHYFGHSAKTLTRHEAAQLAVTLPSPLKRNPGKATPYFKRQTNVVEGRMARYGRIDLKTKPKKRSKEDDETLWDFIKWVKKQKKDK